MKIYMSLLTILILVSCASKKDPAWDSGAQKEEAIEYETKQEQMKTLQYQFPGNPIY